MSKTLLTVTFAALLCAGLIAQTPGQSQSQAPAGGAATTAPAGGSAAPAQAPTQKPAPSAAANAVTIQGCIQKSAASSSGTPGATGTAGAMSDSFVLANAARPAGATMPANVASSYRLDADASKLTPHVGHKVEITGTIEAPPATAPPAPTGSAPAAAAPRFKVDNVKMLAASCTP